MDFSVARLSVLVLAGLELYRNSTVAASAPVAERSVKLKRLVTHRFHKAQVYCVNCYSDPVW